MAFKSTRPDSIEFAYEMIRENTQRIGNSTTRLGDARLRLIDSVARVRQNYDISTRRIHDDTAD
jgi:hypothetical protein